MFKYKINSTLLQSTRVLIFDKDCSILSIFLINNLSLSSLFCEFDLLSNWQDNLANRAFFNKQDLISSRQVVKLSTTNIFLAAIVVKKIKLIDFINVEAKKFVDKFVSTTQINTIVKQFVDINSIEQSILKKIAKNNNKNLSIIEYLLFKK